MKLRKHYEPAEFARLVSREDDIERKTGVGLGPLQETFVAMSNTRGGAVLVGVKDDGTVVGRKLDQGTDEKLHEAALVARDVGRYRVREIDVGGTPVIAVEIERRVEGFTQTSDGRVLVRRGGRNQALYGLDLARFINERRLTRFELADSRVPVRDADPLLLSELRKAFGWPPRSDASDRLRERGLANDHGRLTVAGALFLTDPGQSLRHSKAIIEVRRYPEGRREYDRREEFGGPLHRQLAAASRFVMDELGSDVVVNGLYRYELPRLPEVVVREAIANAVAHRSYEAQGSAVIVELRSEVVVVSSPGRLPEPVTIETLRQAQAARNVHVIDVLRRFKLAEDAGRGIDVMQDSMDEALLDPPVFEELAHGVRVVLPLHGSITARERAWVADLERRGDIHGRDRLLLVHAARGVHLTNAGARAILSIDSVGARQALQRLRDTGLLFQHGSRGGASYSLSGDIAPPAAFRMSPRQLEEMVLAEADAQPLSNEVVRRVTGLDRRRARVLLQRLVSSGMLSRIGDRRGTRYVRVRT
jgi:ATP-dependent DNA helicase RecG